MEEEVDGSLFFSDGCMTGWDSLVVAGQYNAYPDEDMSRVMFKFGEEWTNFDVDDDMIRSLAYDTRTATCYLLGKNGSITRCGGTGRFTMDDIDGTFETDHVDDVGEYGELMRVRFVAGTAYACGQSGQVYKREATAWEHADKGVLNKQGKTLEDIDGFAANDLYTVGLGGSAFHFDGTTWSRIDLGTNVHLSNVRCSGDGSVFVCGNSGVLARGRRGSDVWEVLRNVDRSENYWGMDLFRGRVYLAHVNGMDTFDGKVFNSVDFGAGRAISCHRVHAHGGAVASFGVDDLFVYDGRRWAEVICPEN